MSAAFNTLRQHFMSPSVLDYPDFSKDNIFNLHTDASGHAMGAVLSNKTGKPVAYVKAVVKQ